MKNLSYYINLPYSIEIKTMPDGIICADLKEIPGLCTYGNTINEAIEELDRVKSAAFELMIAQKKEIPVPKIKLEIPYDSFGNLPFSGQLSQYVVV